MKVTLATGSPEKLDCDLLALPVFESDVKEARNRLKALTAVDEALGGLLLKAAGEEDFKGKAEQSFGLHTHDRIGARRVLLLGLGPRQKFEPEVLRQAAGRAVKAAGRLGAKTLVFALSQTREFEACVKASAEGVVLGTYKFDRYKSSEGEKKKGGGLADVKLLLPETTAKSKELQAQLDLGLQIAAATNWARDAVNEPPNAVTPTVLAKLAQGLAKEAGLKIEVFDLKKIEELKMGMFSAVARGSVEAPKLIHMVYEPKNKKDRARPPVAFVGKAITFDSGGLSLKPTDGMVDMKTDMAGSAAVFGAMRVIAGIQPPFPVHAFVGACENMPGGRAYKPGDVLTSRIGKTVEVTNTDAEGRLVLGDVLAWANDFKPACIIDLATLTGACVVALGNYITGVFGQDDATVWGVLEAAKAAGEEMWRMPVTDLQKDALKSEIADMKNSGERWGSAISAALFLREFVGETPWVHLDIAGPSTSPKERGYFSKGATGVGVRTLVEFIRSRALNEEALQAEENVG